MIVAIEGIDAAGKKTQADAIVVAMRSTGFLDWPIRQHDFPHYETTAGGVIGRILRGEIGISEGRDKAVIMQSVFVANRLEWLALLVEYAQTPSNLLVLDRYKLSGVAFGAAEGLEAEWVRMVQSCLPDADLNLFLDISVEESVRRRPVRRDLNESDLGKQQRARDAYRYEFIKGIEEDPFSHLIVDGSQHTEIITQEIVSAIWQRLHMCS